MIERIVTALQDSGWLIRTLSQGWLGAWEPTRQQGVALREVLASESLPPLEAAEAEGLDDVLVICPEGVDSSLLRQNSKRQYWFWDLRTGQIFPYPQADSECFSGWLNAVLQGQVNSLDELKQNTRHSPYVTYALLAMNAAVFMLMELSGGSTNTDVLVRFGAKVNQLIQQGEVWRLFTANFIHVGPMHLAFNLYALWTLGPFAEGLFGHKRFIALYLLSGIAGTTSSFLFSTAISAGASAAIFGLLGALILYSWRHPQLWRSGLGMNLVVVTAVNLIFGMIQPGIDNFAHLGGLVSGALLVQIGEWK